MPQESAFGVSLSSSMKKHFFINFFKQRSKEGEKLSGMFSNTGACCQVNVMCGLPVGFSRSIRVAEPNST